jgi:osmotically inducible protein OsmC
MPTRESSAVWEGSIAKGSGVMRFGSGAYEGAYDVPSRFEDGEGTNPEELIAAAHAGCFSMQLSGILTRAGSPPDRISTTAAVTVEKFDDGWRITQIHLTMQAEVPGISDEDFQEHAEAAKNTCPVSKALAAVEEITLDATLVG